MREDAALDAALRYAQAGFRPEPMWRAGARCIPCRRRYYELAASEAAAVEAAFAAFPRAVNVGVVLGECKAGNPFVLDIDVGHAAGVDGRATARELFENIGGRPPGPVTRTPRGGWHVWLGAPSGFVVANLSGTKALRPGVDVRGYRSIVPAPPSRRRDGAYVALADLWSIPLPAAPPALLRLIERREASPSRIPNARPRARFERDGASTALADAALQFSRELKPGRSMRLFHLAARFGAIVAAGKLHEGDVRARLIAASRANGLLAENGLSDVRSTIERGMAIGHDDAQDFSKRNGRS